MSTPDTSASETGLGGLWRRIGPRPGQSLVWWLIEMQRGTGRQVAAVILFVLAFRFVFQWSWSLSVAMLLSMFLHEAGHAVVFSIARIRSAILFLFPLGAVAAPVTPEEDRRSEALHWNSVAWLLQVGVGVNVLLMLAFLGVNALVPRLAPGPDAAALLGQFARDMVYVNGLLASMNLVPLWTLDSGQLFHVLYSSLKEAEDNWLTGVLLGGTIVVLLLVLRVTGFLSWTVIVVNVIRFLGWVVFLLIFAVGILNKQGRDNPLHAYSKQAMSNEQVVMHLFIYIALVGTTLWLFAGSPL